MNKENNEVLNIFDTNEVLEIDPIDETIKHTTQNINNQEDVEEVLEIDPIDKKIENTTQNINNQEDVEEVLEINTTENTPLNINGTKIINNINDVEKKQNKQKKLKKYVSYTERISRHITFVIICIIILIISIIGYNKYKEITIQYQKNSTANYQVCLKENDYYKDTCQKENIEYISSLTDKIRADFTYTEVYQEKVNKKYKYYINSEIITQTDQEDAKDLLKEEKPLTETKVYNGEANVININETIEIPFQKYNDYAQKYINDYSLMGNSKIVISLIIKNGDEEQEVSSISIPLTNVTYNITKTETAEQTAEYVTKSDSNIKKIFIITIIISSILLLISILSIIKFIYKTTNKQSKYQKEIKRILNIYDRVIITLEDKNTIVNENEVYTVKTFLELLDVRDTIDKPILYYKVNDIKTEFYVQDINKTYKYTMKEVDFEEKK